MAVHFRKFVFGLLLTAACLPTSVPTIAQAQTQASLTISPDSGTAGAKFHVHGTGFQDFSLVTNVLDLGIFDANSTLVDQGSVAAADDGTIDADIDTTGDTYTSGTYSVLASYTYWGVRRDPVTQRVLCDFCPVKTVPLADSVTFTIE